MAGSIGLCPHMKYPAFSRGDIYFAKRRLGRDADGVRREGRCVSAVRRGAVGSEGYSVGIP